MSFTQDEINQMQEEHDKTNGLIAEDGHAHKFTTGVLPGMKKVLICTVPGCGLTKDA